MQAPIFLEEVGAKLITSRHRFGPYIARAFAITSQLYFQPDEKDVKNTRTEHPCPRAFQRVLRVLVLHSMQDLTRCSLQCQTVVAAALPVLHVLEGLYHYGRYVLT